MNFVNQIAGEMESKCESIRFINSQYYWMKNMLPNLKSFTYYNIEPDIFCLNHLPFAHLIKLHIGTFNLSCKPSKILQAINSQALSLINFKIKFSQAMETLNNLQSIILFSPRLSKLTIEVINQKKGIDLFDIIKGISESKAKLTVVKVKKFKKSVLYG